MAGSGTEHTGYAQLRDELQEMGVLRLEGDHCIFTKSYAFNSPSAAAAVIDGRPADGTIGWKVKGTAQTYKDWEAAQLARADMGAA